MTSQTGDVLYAGTTSDTDKLNGITNEVNQKSEIHIKSYTSASEVEYDRSSYGNTSKNFTLNAPVNSYVLSVYYKADLNHQSVAGSAYVYSTIRVNGTNLGTKYITNDRRIESSDYISGDIKSSETAYFIRSNPDNVCSNTLTKPFKILDSSTTFTIRTKANNDASSTAHKIKDVEIYVVYATPVTED